MKLDSAFGMKRKPKPFKVQKLNADFYFTPRGPWEKGRASFTLLRGQYVNGKKQPAEMIVTPFLHDLNQRFKAGLVTAADGRRELEAYRDALYKELEAKKFEGMSQSNVELIQGFIDKRLTTKVDILPGSVRSQVDTAWRLVKRFGKISIASASTNEIQRVLNSIESEGSFKQEFTTARALLKFIHRHADADMLKAKKFPPKEPAYLTKEQVSTLLDAIPDPVLKSYPAIDALIIMIYQLGVRVGEALALEKSCVVKRGGLIVVRVEKQLSRRDEVGRDGSILRGTKNRRVREVVPLSWNEFKGAFSRWLGSCPTLEERERYRVKVSKLVHELSVKLFSLKDKPADEKDVFFFNDEMIPDAEDMREYRGVHMLRASHAREIMEVFGNESFAANQIGDTPEVMRKHYSGRTNSEKAMAAFSKAINSQ